MLEDYNIELQHPPFQPAVSSIQNPIAPGLRILRCFRVGVCVAVLVEVSQALLDGRGIKQPTYKGASVRYE